MRITVGERLLKQWPEKIEVSLLIPRDVYRVLWETAVNQEPQISVVEVIQMCIEKATEEVERLKKEEELMSGRIQKLTPIDPDDETICRHCGNPEHEYPHPVVRETVYLPLDCPNCGRHRLEFDGYHVVCEKCGSCDWVHPKNRGKHE